MQNQIDIFENIRVNVYPSTVIDPEDLKGLREWVVAKRICEVNPEKKYGQMYSAPWRIG